MVVFDPEKRVTLAAATQHSMTDYNLYEGVEVTGLPEVVVRRGEISSTARSSSRSPGRGSSCGAPASGRS
jgi:dihydropyrimidinase